MKEVIDANKTIAMKSIKVLNILDAENKYKLQVIARKPKKAKLETPVEESVVAEDVEQPIVDARTEPVVEG